MKDMPTVTVMNHGPARPSRTRFHDPPLADHGMPGWAAKILTMDLGLEKSRKKKAGKIVIWCSPYQRCIESAVVVAQELGVQSIRVHYGLGESCSAIRTAGWDWAYCPLYLSPDQMRLVVSNMEEPGRLIKIESIQGRQQSTTDIIEADDQLFLRVSETLELVKSEVNNPGDHSIVIAHKDTMRIFVQHFGPSATAQVFDEKHCSFATLAVASQECYWLKTRSRVKVFAEPS